MTDLLEFIQVPCLSGNYRDPLSVPVPPFHVCLLEKKNTLLLFDRSTIYENLLNLVPTNISRRGNSNPSDLSEWVPLFKVPPNDSANLEIELSGFCTGIPANLNLWFFTSVVGAIEGVPQREILGAEVNFQMNYFEYDCSRNDVCWPELAYPLTRHYQGETYSQSIAQAMLLVFFFLVAAVLGDPWNNIRKAWHKTTFR
ncbi:tectonic-2-like [Rhincodon typus]|uniref:tectonic-2-like n=1 Tax=Rhincodon typus TaxID=259920 RepID=UPI00202F2E97|nr:tectonic-2-like [Rhincodon typus]